MHGSVGCQQNSIYWQPSNPAHDRWNSIKENSMRNKIIGALFAIVGAAGGLIGGDVALNSTPDTVKIEMTACHEEDDCTMDWHDGAWYLTVDAH